MWRSGSSGRCIGPRFRLMALGFIIPLVASCGGGNASAGSKHMAYTYNTAIFPSRSIWHPGEHIRVRVKPSSGQLTSKQNLTHIVMRLQLFGPYGDISSLKRTGRLGYPVAWTAAQTTTWSGRTLAPILTLPLHLRSGYYNLVQSITERTSSGSSTMAGAGVITVRARG